MTDEAFPCPACGSLLSPSPFTAESTVRCPRCSHRFDPPAGRETAFRPPPPAGVTDRPLVLPGPAPEPDEDAPIDPRPQPRRDVNLTYRYRADVGRWVAIARRHWGALFVPLLGYALQGLLLLGVCGTVVVFLHFLSRNQASPVTFPLLAFTAAAVVLGPLAAAIRNVQGRGWHFGDLFAGLRWFNSLGLYTFLMAVQT